MEIGIQVEEGDEESHDRSTDTYQTGDNACCGESVGSSCGRKAGTRPRQPARRVRSARNPVELNGTTRRSAAR